MKSQNFALFVKSAKTQNKTALLLTSIALGQSMLLLNGSILPARSAPAIPTNTTANTAPIAHIAAQHPVAAPNVPSASSLLTSSITAGLQKVLGQSQTINIANLKSGILPVSGNWINTNTLSFYSTNSNIKSVEILSKGSIFNPVGASIITASGIDLNIVAATGVYNAGAITSGGALSVTAPNIFNVHPSSLGISGGAAPILQASAGAITLQTNTLLNQGIVNSVKGNINITPTPSSSSLAINSIGGSFTANNGTGVINIGSQNTATSLNLQILGGDFYSSALNLGAGTGTITMQSDAISGVVNATAANVSISTTGTMPLYLGAIKTTGDPTLDAAADVYLTADFDQGTGPLNVSSAADILNEGASTLIWDSIQLTAAGSVNLAGISLVESDGPINVVAQGGSVNASGTQFVSTLQNPLFQQEGLVPYTIGIFAHNSISTGELSGTYLFVRGGANFNFLEALPGYNPGSVNVNKLTITTPNTMVGSTTVTGQGQAYVDDFGGPVTVGSVKGSGSTIYLETSEALTVNSGITNTNPGPGGYIYLLANSLNVGGPGIQNSSSQNGGGSVTASVQTAISTSVINNNAYGTGGTVALSAQTFAIPHGILNEATNGGGGTVSVTGYNPSGLVLPGGISVINDNAGTAGGSVSISNEGPLTINNGLIKAAAGNGTGANVTLSVGYSTTGVGGGALTENANINVSSTGTGNGGSIRLYSDNMAPGGAVIINGNLIANGVNGGSIVAKGSNNTAGSNAVILNGSLTANGSSGSGGTVLINTTLGTNAALMNSGSKITANGSTGGGSVSVTTTDGITLNGTSITANGTGTGNGGTISITDASVGGGGGGGTAGTPSGGPVIVNCDLFANAGQAGNGGTITISTSGAGNAVTVGGGASLTALGGTRSGNGGNISITSPGDILAGRTALTGLINVSARGVGNGGAIVTAASGDLRLRNSLTANGSAAR